MNRIYLEWFMVVVLVNDTYLKVIYFSHYL